MPTAVTVAAPMPVIIVCAPAPMVVVVIVAVGRYPVMVTSIAPNRVCAVRSTPVANVAAKFAPVVMTCAPLPMESNTTFSKLVLFAQRPSPGVLASAPVMILSVSPVPAPASSVSRILNV